MLPVFARSANPVGTVHKITLYRNGRDRIGSTLSRALSAKRYRIIIHYAVSVFRGNVDQSRYMGLKREYVSVHGQTWEIRAIYFQHPARPVPIFSPPPDWTRLFHGRKNVFPKPSEKISTICLYFFAGRELAKKNFTDRFKLKFYRQQWQWVGI